MGVRLIRGIGEINMTRIDKQINKELKAKRRKENTGKIVDFFQGCKDKVLARKDEATYKFEAWKEDLKEKTAFQKKAKKAFDNYLHLHDESKIGICEIERLENGGLRVVVYTARGPIIKTIEHASEDCQENIDERCIDQDFYFDNKRTFKVSYEGYCSWEERDGFEHPYYANVTKTYGERPTSKEIDVQIFNGFERKDNVKFRVVREIKIWYVPEIYSDLQATFKKHYHKTRVFVEHGDMIYGRFGEKLFNTDLGL